MAKVRLDVSGMVLYILVTQGALKLPAVKFHAASKSGKVYINNQKKFLQAWFLL